MTTTAITSCSACQASWPAEPARPSLVGGCSECKREYSRRYNAQPEMVETRRVSYLRDAPKRRQESRAKYHATERRFKKYGITQEIFEQMLKDQDDQCALCDTDLTPSSAHIDHDHNTGSVRGLLCSNCNRALGHFKDNVEVLKRAINYLNPGKV